MTTTETRRWGHIELPPEATMERRDSLRPGDVVISSHYGRRTVIAADTRGIVGPGTTYLSFGGHMTEAYPADGEIPVLSRAHRRVTVTLQVDLDLEAYATDYGMLFDEAEKDAPGHLTEIAVDAFGERLTRLGYATVVTE